MKQNFTNAYPCSLDAPVANYPGRASYDTKHLPFRARAGFKALYGTNAICLNVLNTCNFKEYLIENSTYFKIL
jgi:hypothetical protein